MTNLFEIFNKAYPVVASGKSAWQISSGVGLFVFFFLWVFQPFELDTLEQGSTLIFVGYGAITFLVLLIFFLVQRFLFQESTWTTWKQIIFYAILINSIAILNFYYTKSYHPNVGLSVVNFISYTFWIAIFPIVFLSYIHQQRMEKKHIQHSDAINEHLTTNAVDRSDHESTNLRITPTDQIPVIIPQMEILYIESVGNYLWIHHKAGDENQKHKVRGTITNILQQLDKSIFQKTHRAFILNLHEIQQISGNAQGLKVQLQGVQETIPVSRNFVTALKDRLNQ